MGMSQYMVEDQRVKEALKEEEGTGSHYDGYTVEDHKRDTEPPPPEMCIEEFRKRQKANQWQPIDPNDPSWSAPAPPEVTPQDLPEWEHPPLAATDWATGTPAPSRMIRDNPDIKRFHPDYGGVPGKGVPKKQWYGTGNHPLNR